MTAESSLVAQKIIFFYSCINGEVEKVKKALENPLLDVNDAVGRDDFYSGNVTALHGACKHNQAEVVKLLLASHRIDVTLTGRFNRTPLFIACENGSKEVVEVLLSDPRTALVNVCCSGDYTTPLYMAVVNNHIEVVRCLIASGKGLQLRVGKLDAVSYARLFNRDEIHKELCAYQRSLSQKKE